MVSNNGTLHLTGQAEGGVTQKLRDAARNYVLQVNEGESLSRREMARYEGEMVPLALSEMGLADNAVNRQAAQSTLDGLYAELVQAHNEKVGPVPKADEAILYWNVPAKGQTQGQG